MSHILLLPQPWRCYAVVAVTAILYAGGYALGLCLYLHRHDKENERTWRPWFTVALWLLFLLANVALLRALGVLGTPAVYLR